MQNKPVEVWNRDGVSRTAVMVVVAAVVVVAIQNYQLHLSEKIAGYTPTSSQKKFIAVKNNGEL